MLQSKTNFIITKIIIDGINKNDDDSLVNVTNNKLVFAPCSLLKYIKGIVNAQKK